MTFTDQPPWIARLPKAADPLCVAASIERSVPPEKWGEAVGQALLRGWKVDTQYLRDRRAITRGHI